jgi:hypothetical protein
VFNFIQPNDLDPLHFFKFLSIFFLSKRTISPHTSRIRPTYITTLSLLLSNLKLTLSHLLSLSLSQTPNKNSSKYLNREHITFNLKVRFYVPPFLPIIPITGDYWVLFFFKRDYWVLYVRDIYYQQVVVGQAFQEISLCIILFFG